jgi:hypothetical protein
MRNRIIHAAVRKCAVRLGSLAVLAALLVGVAPLARAAEIAIVQPAAEQTIHSNAGDVSVVIRASGAAPDSRVRFIVDGSAWPENTEGHAITLTGLDRGTHVVRAELLGTDGTVLATSQPVTFYVWHASRLFRHRTP